MAIDKIPKKHGVSYRVRVTLPNGRRKTRCFDRRVNAEIWEAKVKVEAKDASRIQRRRMRFSELATLFIANHAKTAMAFSSYQKYEGALRLYVVPEFGRLWIDEISKLQVVEYRAAVERTDLSANMKYFVFTTFKTVMKKALEWDLVDKNPADAVRPPRKGMARTEYWKTSEIHQFLDGNRFNPQLPLYLIALNTGMRLGEILGLKWDCVDLENGLINVRRIYCQKSNSIKETTKTHRARQIGINPALRSALVKLQQGNTSEFVLEGKNYRTKAYHYSRLLAQACKQASVRPIKFHDLRHTYATAFVMNGGSIHALSGTLGHTSTTMTSRYAHYGPEHALKAAQVVSFDVPETGNLLQFNYDKRKNPNRIGHKLVINR